MCPPPAVPTGLCHRLPGKWGRSEYGFMSSDAPPDGAVLASAAPDTVCAGYALAEGVAYVNGERAKRGNKKAAACSFLHTS